MMGWQIFTRSFNLLLTILANNFQFAYKKIQIKIYKIIFVRVCFSVREFSFLIFAFSSWIIRESSLKYMNYDCFNPRPVFRNRNRKRKRERARKREEGERRRKRASGTRADTGPSVNGWMNLGEKGCLWATESVAARLINEALAGGGPRQGGGSTATPLSGRRANRQISLTTYLSANLSINLFYRSSFLSAASISIVNQVLVLWKSVFRNRYFFLD